MCSYIYSTWCWLFLSAMCQQCHAATNRWCQMALKVTTSCICCCSGTEAAVVQHECNECVVSYSSERFSITELAVRLQWWVCHICQHVSYERPKWSANSFTVFAGRQCVTLFQTTEWLSWFDLFVSLSMACGLEVKREYYQNSSVLDCVTQCSQSAAHLCEQFLQVKLIGFVTLGPSLRCA